MSSHIVQCKKCKGEGVNTVSTHHHDCGGEQDCQRLCPVQDWEWCEFCGGTGDVNEDYQKANYTEEKETELSDFPF